MFTFCKQCNSCAPLVDKPVKSGPGGQILPIGPLSKANIIYTVCATFKGGLSLYFECVCVCVRERE